MEKQCALIVEDNPHLSRIFALALQAAFAVDAVFDGQQALEYLAGHSPAVVILDLNLPKSSGQEVLQWMRAQPRLANTRVILATADAGKAEELSAKADLVLLKPISPVQLQTLAARITA